ncbi:MAG TPA: hypothetical protein VII38_07015, partial [Polyangia bacterium]
SSSHIQCGLSTDALPPRALAVHADLHAPFSKPCDEIIARECEPWSVLKASLPNRRGAASSGSTRN